MNCDSDGTKTKTQKGGIIRHFSLGSMPREEINKIIGINMDEKREEITTYIDKHKSKKRINKPQQEHENNDESEIAISTRTIQGGTNDSDNAFWENNENGNEDVFKPRLSIRRTPPKGDIEQNVVGQICNKRQRSETSPEAHATKKRQYDINQNDGENQITGFSEERIMQIFNHLDKFMDVANRPISSLTSDDQTGIKEAHNKLHKLLTLVVFNYGALEKENIKLKKQLEMQEFVVELDNGMKTNKIHNQVEMNYAGAVITDNNKDPKNKGYLPEQTKQWTTPPTIKRHETVIRIENVHDPKQAFKQLKSEINDQDVGKGFKSIRQTKNGAIIIESFNKDQQEKLKVAIQEKQNIKFKESQDTNPMFIITGINKGFSDAELLKEIESLNHEIVEELGYSVSDKIRIIAKKPCRNIEKENWILQAPPAIAKWFLKKGTIFIDLVRVYVQEHYNLALCFKCCGYGHVAKYCREKECCHKCGEEHAGKDCKETEMKCSNCVKFKLGAANHSARDKKCPLYQRMLDRLKHSTNYNDFL